MVSMLLCSLLLQTPRDLPAAAPSAGSAIIGGVVTTTEGTSRTPLRRAIVSIAGTGIIVRQVATDEQGRFAFEALPPGRFTLTVEKGGYLKTFVGSRRPGRPPSLPIAVVAGQRVIDLAVDVPRGSVIEGTVRDELGGPLATAQVSVLQRLMVAGEPRFSSVAGVSRVVADDRGRYRIYGLPPGDYVVQTVGGGTLTGAEVATDQEIKAAEAAARAGASTGPRAKPTPPRVVTRSIVYAPGVTDLRSAQVISLGVGEERAGIDLSNALVSAAALDLLVTAPSGPPQNPSIGIASVSRQSVFTGPGIVRPGANSHFVMPGMAPGHYLFYGSASEAGPNGTSMPLYLSAEVTVDGADMSVSLDFLRGQTVSGQLVAAPTLPTLTGARVTLVAEGRIPGTMLRVTDASVNADGSFAVTGVPPGRYRISLSGVGGWTLVSATLSAADVLDTPLEVRSGADITGIVATITNRLTEISGIVTDSAGRPSPEYTALVIPADRALWMTAPRRTSGLVKIASDGRYQVTGLPPGDYLLAVIVDADPQQLADPAFLEQIAAGAIPVRLTEGQKLVQNLKIGG